MNKKYQIVNSNSNEDCTIFYLLYIVLIFIVIFIIYKIIYNFSYQEDFAVVSTENKLSPEQIMQELQQKNNQLSSIKNTLQEKLQEQSKAIYISSNFNKVDSSSFNDELSFLLLDFANTKLPTIDTTNKKIIENQTQLNVVLNEAKNMKNFYNPGDIVTESSNFNITRDDICYRSEGKAINPTPTFMEQYPNCMVCSTEPEQSLYHSNTWFDTKTNINQVCLFNPTAESNSGIANLSQCQKFCSINSAPVPTPTLLNTAKYVAETQNKPASSEK